jgi:hypothetical protein
MWETKEYAEHAREPPEMEALKKKLKEIVDSVVEEGWQMVKQVALSRLRKPTDKLKRMMDYRSGDSAWDLQVMDRRGDETSSPWPWSPPEWSRRDGVPYDSPRRRGRLTHTPLIAHIGRYIGEV